MVTYIDTKNREKYQVLFDKAEQTLKNAENLPEGIDRDSVEIATLNQYFAYLKDLITVSSNENIKSYFLRLPLDEELFAINANTRSISIPSSFNRNGVGVQGDESAEIVYFSIDRFFDHVDLARDDMHIVIQWETKDKNRQTISGISPNFGKDIETVPGKIIFGWPIYSELTESATPIRFAVRFFSLGAADSEGVRALNYSLATLPAEISVGATINYDLINKTVMEIDRGKMITDRVANSMTGRRIYDPSAPIPAEPVISTPLSVVGESASVRVVDLPDEEGGVIALQVGARPTDFGAIQYDWQRFAYDSASGEYTSTSDPFASEVIYEEVSSLGNDTYYAKSLVNGVEAYSVFDTSLLEPNASYVEGSGFPVSDGSFVQLYKKLSIATVDSVGIYTVNIGARYGANSVATTMDREDGITVPGPLKPTIADPEEVPGKISVTDDHVIHVIVTDGAVTLSTAAHKSEQDENAQVVLSYDWKKKIGDVEDSVSGESVESCPVQIALLGRDGHGHVPEDENEASCAANQSNVTLVQKGANVFIYRTGDELISFNSTNPEQGEGKWIGFDIDTGKDSIVGLIWGASYELTSGDEVEAAGIGLGAGHIVFWAKAEDLANSRAITVDGTSLTITFVDAMPTSETYSFNEDKSSLTIEGLAASGLDEMFVAEVTAKRNKVSTFERSGIYRLTNAPEKPVISVYDNGRKEMDYQSENNTILVRKIKNGMLNTLNFSVAPIEHSDKLSYIWMLVNQAEDTDQLKIDINDALGDLFPDDPSRPGDIPMNDSGEIEFSQFHIGSPVSSSDEENGPGLKLTDAASAGQVYYCIVLNELNDHLAANATPFFVIR